MKLLTPEYLSSHSFETFIKQYMLAGRESEAKFAHHVRVCVKLIVEDLKMILTYLWRWSGGIYQLYSSLLKFIKSSKLHIDKLYESAKNLYEILNSFIIIASLLRDLCVYTNLEPDEAFNETLSTLNLSMNELARQINIEQTNRLTSTSQFKDSVKVLESELLSVYGTLELTLSSESPIQPVPIDDILNPRYRPYLDMSIQEIIDELYGPNTNG